MGVSLSIIHLRHYYLQPFDNCFFVNGTTPLSVGLSTENRFVRRFGICSTPCRVSSNHLLCARLLILMFPFPWTHRFLVVCNSYRPCSLWYFLEIYECGSIIWDVLCCFCICTLNFFIIIYCEKCFGQRSVHNKLSDKSCGILRFYYSWRASAWSKSCWPKLLVNSPWAHMSCHQCPISPQLWRLNFLLSSLMRCLLYLLFVSARTCSSLLLFHY